MADVAESLVPTPHGDAPDTGMSPPGGVEETEAAVQAARTDTARTERPAR